MIDVINILFSKALVTDTSFCGANELNMIWQKKKGKQIKVK